ncbi:phenoloxidase-activating factor 2-like [Photinus pyralis]|nr:phenoloxidase-activating factor 2-like [Photinus pyralis]XP_031359392.1 phenoloxidase-activating factor 2-like [Photinus pyralis]
MKQLIIILSTLLHIHAQQDKVQVAIDKIFTTSTGNYFDQYEEVTSPRNDGFGAEQKCGQGSDEGVHRCVRYFNCDGETRTIIPSEEYDGTGLIDIRFGNNNCDDYLDVCCQIPADGKIPPEVTSPPDVTPMTPTLPPDQPSFCGIRNPNGVGFKITGNSNNEAEYGEFPWMLAILNKNPGPDGLSSICGASLIAPNVVLTGAHCVQNVRSSDIKVRAGEWDTQTESERYAYQEREIQQIVIHEGYKSNNLFNDVALIVLNRPFDKAAHIGTICLPHQGVVVNSRNCFVSGWGKDVFGKKGRFQVILKKIELPTVSKGKCEENLRKTRLGAKFVLHQSFMCAGGESGVDACTGDGGGPLVCPDPSNPKRYVQAGIVAWGIGCGQRDVPGVYVDVSRFRGWIDGHMTRLNLDTAPYNL